MQLHVAPTAHSAARLAAEIVVAELSRVSRPLLGLAAGGTFDPIYPLLPDGAGWRGAQLDEYVGLPDGDPRSFRAWLAPVLARGVVEPEHALLLRSDADDPESEIAAHAQAIKAGGGLDLQLLGLGTNGHLAFNEPGSRLENGARVVELAEATRIRAAASFAPDDPPTRGMTLGLKEIAAARRIVLAVFGSHKARPLAQALEGTPGPMAPFSLLRDRSSVIVVADAAAAAGLARRAG